MYTRDEAKHAPNRPAVYRLINSVVIPPVLNGAHITPIVKIIIFIIIIKIMDYVCSSGATVIVSVFGGRDENGQV